MASELELIWLTVIFAQGTSPRRREGQTRIRHRLDHGRCGSSRDAHGCS